MSTDDSTNPEAKGVSQAERNTANQAEAPAAAACQRGREITQLPVEKAGTTADLDDSSHRFLPNPDDRWITDVGPELQLVPFSSLNHPNEEDSLFVSDSRSSVEPSSLPPADVQMAHPDEIASSCIQDSVTSIQPPSFPPADVQMAEAIAPSCNQDSITTMQHSSFPPADVQMADTIALPCMEASLNSMQHSSLRPADVQMIHPDETALPRVQGTITSIQPPSFPPTDVQMADAIAPPCNQDSLTSIQHSYFQPADVQMMHSDGSALEQPTGADLSDTEIAALMKVLDGQRESTTRNVLQNPEPMNPELDEAAKNHSAHVIDDDGNTLQSLDNVPVVSSASSGAEDAHPRSVNLAHDDDEAEWPDDELDAIAQQDLSDAKFKEAERHFQSISNPSMEDKIRLEAAEMEEEARKRRVAARKAVVAENQSTFFNDEESEAGLDEQVPAKVMAQPSKSTVQPSQHVAESIDRGKQPRGPRSRKNRISAEEKRKSKKYGLKSTRGRSGVFKGTSRSEHH